MWYKWITSTYPERHITEVPGFKRGSVICVQTGGAQSTRREESLFFHNINTKNHDNTQPTHWPGSRTGPVMSRIWVPYGIPTWDPCDFVRGARTGHVCGYPPGNPQVTRRVTRTGPVMSRICGTRVGFPRGTQAILSAGPARGPCAGTRRATRRLPAGQPARVPARNSARSHMGPWRQIRSGGWGRTLLPFPSCPFFLPPSSAWGPGFAGDF